ncbi:MAG TPA: RNA polymerase sigma factor [Tepidisphaeraceae bacterium]|nr:RNA polymerase sigma factor [Tepidisphaeraceae bacterium]
MIDWEGIVAREGPGVWRRVYRLLGNRADADEVFQETFLAALSFAKRSVVQSWGALLHRLASARAVDRLRQRQRRNTRQEMADFDCVGGGEPEPFQNAEAGELSARLRVALGRLPERQAEVFCLHALEGWKHEEIAREMDISSDAVGVLLHRARARLRELLAPALKVERQVRT